uniref:Clp R domain-containing protein n=1 Tax=Arundo donax TaxID=35708 RepID=A0A0A9CJC8_ARUDO
MRCRAGCPSLEILWELQTLAVPAGSLALSLNCVDNSAMAVSSHQSTRAKCEASGNGSVSRCMSLWDAGGSGQLTAISGCCGDCCANAAKALARSIVPSSSSIPPWLQRCRDREPSHCKKWSSTCGGSQSHARTTLNFSAVVSPSSSVSSYEQHYHHLHQPWLVADAHETKHTWKAARCGGGQVHVLDDDDVKIVSAIKVTSHDSSASNGAAAEVECRSMFKELSAENHKVLCSALEKEVPWQAELVPEIASAVLRCRSGVARRRDNTAAARPSSGAKEDTWLLFLGCDADGKERVARELASLVFGSRKSFVSIGGATASSPARSDSSEQPHRRKRPRSTEKASNGSCLDRLYEAVRDNPHRVIFLDDVEQAGRRCQMGVLEAIESGVVRSPGGDGEAALGDAIVVLSCECLDSRSRNSSLPPPPTAKKAKMVGEEASKEEEGTGDHHNEDTIAAAVSSSPSSSCFDLNVRVENDEVEESCFRDAGLLKAVDRVFFFRQPGQSSD